MSDQAKKTFIDIYEQIDSQIDKDIEAIEELTVDVGYDQLERDSPDKEMVIEKVIKPRFKISLKKKRLI